MKKTGIATLLIFTCAVAKAQQPSYAQAVATTAMERWPDTVVVYDGTPAKARSEQALILKGIEGIWQATGDGKWFGYLQKSIDPFVQDEGTIRGATADDLNRDNFNYGKMLLLLYQVTGKEKYRKAVVYLRDQLHRQPHAVTDSLRLENVFSHPAAPDVFYMVQPFYAAYAKAFGEDKTFNAITRQFGLMEKGAGLTAQSSQLRGKDPGWYGMAMVDVLDYFPPAHPGRDSIIGLLNRWAKAIAAAQDRRTGLWYETTNKKKTLKNDDGTFISSMLVYTLAKAVRKGYLPDTYLPVAEKGYAGLLRQFMKIEKGEASLRKKGSVPVPGGSLNRNGSLAFRGNETKIGNDPETTGAFILASNEMELLPTLSEGKGTVVMLDHWFNREFRKGPNGDMQPYHYLWEEKDNDGFSTFGFVFERYGAKLATLAAAPTAQNLKGAGVYIVVDPDDQKETVSPNIITEKDASAVSDWVKAGGVLVLMGNDSGHTNIRSLNVLATRFGLRLNEDLFNTVQGDQFEQGAVDVSGSKEIFTTAKKIYAKDIATINAVPPARAIVAKEGKNVMAVANFGKGAVFVIGDPWLYNEYTDGRKLPPDFDNYKAAEDLVRWLMAHARKK